jgi:hypothetical protein
MLSCRDRGCNFSFDFFLKIALIISKQYSAVKRAGVERAFDTIA